MLTTDELYELIINNYHELEGIPEETHLLCPRVDDSDTNAYDEPDEPGDDITAEEKQQRIKDGEERFLVASRLSLMLGLNAEQVKSWLETWKTRLETCLRKCDACVRNWHSRRADFLRYVSE
jgi:senataxin